MIYAVVILAFLLIGAGILLDRAERKLAAGEGLRVDLTRQLDDARDERDRAADEIDRAETRIASLRIRADTAEIALAFKTLAAEMPALDAALLARAPRRS
jgi:chromosome segregation ATPase